MSIFICDFQDSFTYNILSELQAINLESQVIPFKAIESELQRLGQTQVPVAIILGPGPGHPNEYEFIYPYLNALFQNENVFLMGICLGHQLIWDYMQMRVDRCHHPIHGQAQVYPLDDFWKSLLGQKKITVQKYNSLAVKLNIKEQKKFSRQGWRLYMHEDELVMSHNNRLITYQFHPESIGTFYRSCFFHPFKKFLL